MVKHCQLQVRLDLFVFLPITDQWSETRQALETTSPLSLSGWMSLLLLIECEVTLLFAVAQLLYDELTELVLNFGKSSVRSFIVLFCCEY